MSFELLFREMSLLCLRKAEILSDIAWLYHEVEKADRQEAFFEKRVAGLSDNLELDGPYGTVRSIREKLREIRTKRDKDRAEIHALKETLADLERKEQVLRK